MKKKFAGLVSGILWSLACNTASFAQEIICQEELELLSNAQDKVSVDKIKLNKDGSFTLYAFSQLRDSTASNKVGYLPALQVFQLDNKLKLKQKVLECYDPLNQHGKTRKSYKEMLKSYADFFQSCNKAGSYSYKPGSLMGKPVILRSAIKYEYDVWSNSFAEVVHQESIPLEVPVYENGNIFIHDEIRIDQQAGLTSMILSNYQEVENAKQLLFLEQTIVNCDLAGKQLSQYHLSFEYPSEIRFHQFLQDHKGNPRGVVYVFGPARRFGFKMTDPDPQNYQIVLLNTEGKKVFNHNFRYGEGGGASELVYVAAHQDQVYVLGKGLGRNPDYHLFVFDHTGLKKASLIDPDMLYSKTIGDYDFSIRKDYSSNFHPKGFNILEDGGILFYGEQRSTVRNAKIDPSTMEKTPAVYEFPAYAFLQFDKEGNFISNFIIEKNPDSDELESAKIRLLSSDSGKLCFWVTEPLIKEQDLHDFQKFYTGRSGEVVHKHYVSKVEASALLTLDLQARSEKVLKIDGGFVNLEGQEYFVYDSLKKELLLIGKLENQQIPSKLVLKKVKL